MEEKNLKEYHVLMHSIDTDGNDIITYPITKAELVLLNTGINLYEALGNKVEGNIFTEAIESLEGNINIFSNEITSFRTEIKLMKDSIELCVDKNTFGKYEEFIQNELNTVGEFMQSTSSWIKLADGRIESKVESKDYELRKKYVDGKLNTVNESIVNQEVSINLLKNQINLLVNTEEYETYQKLIQEELKLINELYKSHTTSIDLLEKEMMLKVESTIFEKRNEYVDTELTSISRSIENAVSSINILDREINLKVSTIIFNETIENLRGDINQANNDATYKVEILSSNGSIFKNGNIDTILKAKIIRGSRDITDTIVASRLIWTRVSNDSSGDLIWNEKYKTGAKEIRVTAEDLSVKAVFNCHLLRND